MRAQVGKVATSGLILAIACVGSLVATNDDTTKEPIVIPFERYHDRHPLYADELMMSYYSPIGFGWPTKFLNIQFDIGLCESFVLSNQLPVYTFLGVDLPFGSFPKGYLAPSKEAKDRRQFGYQGLKMTGGLVNDSMSLQIGKFREVLRDTLIRSVTELDKPQLLQRLTPVGYFGLCPDTDGGDENKFYRNLLLLLHNKGRISTRKFSIEFAPLRGDQELKPNEDGGRLVLGVHTDLEAEAKKAPTTTHLHTRINNDNITGWVFNLDEVRIGGHTIGGKAFTGSDCKAKLTTGLSEIYGPANEVALLYASSGADVMRDGKNVAQYANYHCNNTQHFANITFKIDGFEYVVPPSVYLKRNGNKCYLGIKPSTMIGESIWVLGIDFFQQRTATFDHDKRQMLLSNSEQPVA